MYKKILAGLLVSLTTLSVLASCGNNAGSSSSTDESSSTSAASSSTDSAEDVSKTEETVDWNAKAIEERTEPVELIVNAFTYSGAPADLQMVEDAMNELTLDALNIRAKLVFTDYASRSQQLTLALSGGEQIDQLCPLGLGYAAAAKNDYLLDMESLDDNGNPLFQTYGQDIAEIQGDAIVEACKIGGVLYGIANEREMAQGKASNSIRTDLVEPVLTDLGYGTDNYNPDAEINYVDTDIVVAILKACHDTYPDMITLNPANTMNWYPIDNLGGDYFGVLTNWGFESTEVTNMYEDSGYIEFVKMMRELYLYGCISNDALTDTTSSITHIMSGDTIAYMQNNKPGIKVQEASNCGYDMTIFQTGPDATLSTNVNQIEWSIGYTTIDPVAAMQYLNFAFSSQEWNDLFMYGVEGTHYIVTEDGHYDYPEGITASTVGYNNNANWICPGQFHSGVWVGKTLTYWDDLIEFRNSAKKSIATGFIFDNSSVATQVTACSNVTNEYVKSIEYGMADSETSLAQMNEALYTAGLQDIMDEKQKQFDQWLADKG